MSNYVNDALLDASPYKKQQDEAKQLVNKWLGAREARSPFC